MSTSAIVAGSILALVCVACSGKVTSEVANPDAGGGGLASPGDGRPDGGTGGGQNSPDGPGVPPSDAPGPPGVGRKDAGGPPSTGTDSGAPTGPCAPVDVTAFAPTWKSPVPRQHACTQVQIDAFLTGCLGSTATAQTCAPFQAGAPGYACGKCIATPDTAPHYGALIDHNGYLVPNVAGCVAAATGDTAGTGCGGKILALDQCQAAACKANCPISDNASLAALNMCTTAASDVGGGCAAFATAAECGRGLADAGGTAASCLSGLSFEESYNRIVPIFCL